MNTTAQSNMFAWSLLKGLDRLWSRQGGKQRAWISYMAWRDNKYVINVTGMKKKGKKGGGFFVREAGDTGLLGCCFQHRFRSWHLLISRHANVSALQARWQSAQAAEQEIRGQLSQRAVPGAHYNICRSLKEEADYYVNCPLLTLFTRKWIWHLHVWVGSGGQVGWSAVRKCKKKKRRRAGACLKLGRADWTDSKLF